MVAVPIGHFTLYGRMTVPHGFELEELKMLHQIIGEAISTQETSHPLGDPRSIVAYQEKLTHVESNRP